MFDLIKCLPFFISLTYQVSPNQKRSSDVVANNTWKTTLVFFQTRQLFRITMKLFNLPAHVAHLLRDGHIGLTQGVGRNIIILIGYQKLPPFFKRRYVPSPTEGERIKASTPSVSKKITLAYTQVPTLQISSSLHCHLKSHSPWLAMAGPTTAWASSTLPTAAPSVSGVLTPTLPSSDWINSRILPRRFVFIQVHPLSFYRKSRSGRIRFPTVVGKPISNGKQTSSRSRSFPSEMLKNCLDFSRCVLFRQHFYQSGFKAVISIGSQSIHAGRCYSSPRVIPTTKNRREQSHFCYWSVHSLLMTLFK